MKVRKNRGFKRYMHDSCWGRPPAMVVSHARRNDLNGLAVKP